MAAEAIELNRQGWSGEAIAQHLGVTNNTVCNYLRRFVEGQSLYGLDLEPSVVAEYRALRRERLLVNEERLIERRERLRALSPET